MLRSYSLLGLALALLVSFSGCKKDEDNPSRRAMLTAGNGTWKLTAVTVSPGLPIGGTLVTDFYSQIPDCTKDDLSVFLTASSNNYREEEGATKCSQSNPQVSATGNWTLSNDEKTLSITSTDAGSTTPSTEEITITSMSGSQMVGTFREEFGTVTYTLTATWTKQ